MEVTYLCEVNSEDGVWAAAGVVHAGASCRAVDVSRLHQLLHVAVVLNQVLRQVWDIAEQRSNAQFNYHNNGKKLCRNNSLVWLNI